MYSIGIDIGGTNLAGGILNDKREILIRRTIPFPGASRPYVSVEAMAILAKNMLDETGIDEGEIRGIGLAVPGSIDYERKCVINAHNLGYHDFPLVELLQPYFPEIQIEQENDANAAALAEYYCGALRGTSTGVLITLGTGVGGGLILNDRLFIGGCHNGFELGHISLVDGGEPCTCGNRGCFEAYCSATALIREGKKAIVDTPDCLIAKRTAEQRGAIDAKLVIDCARAGDKAAVRIFREYISHLGSAVASIFNTFDPEVVAIGGGISYTGEFLFAPLRVDVCQKAFYDTIGEIVPAETGNDAGIIGAAMLCEHMQ